MTAYDKNGVKVVFTFDDSGSSVEITATYSNSNISPLNSFLFQAAVPKYITLKMHRQSGNVVPPNGGERHAGNDSRQLSSRTKADPNESEAELQYDGSECARDAHSFRFFRGPLIKQSI